MFFYSLYRMDRVGIIVHYFKAGWRGCLLAKSILLNENYGFTSTSICNRFTVTLLLPQQPAHGSGPPPNM